jgi:DNA-binding LacI/PurR family transcriptional regulator
MENISISKNRRTKCDIVVDSLRDHITSGASTPGERLASMPELAKLYKTSIFTIHQAVAQIESEGYVECRHGAGTFIASRHRPITMADTVTLCMDARGHLWADLSALLMEGLADHGLIGTMLGMEMEHSGRGDMLRRMAHSESDIMIVQAGMHFPFEVFDRPGMADKKIVAALSWCSERTHPHLYRVLHDREIGARLVADHLRAKGHRHVLMLMTPSQHLNMQQELPHDICPALPFHNYWTRCGGTCRMQCSQDFDSAGYGRVDNAKLLAALDDDKPPTAIFGCRDYEAWHAQNIIVQERPELLAKIDIVGYGNTPWSQAAMPPFSTVDFNLDDITRETINAVEAIKNHTKPQALTHVQPRLVIRGNGKPAALS